MRFLYLSLLLLAIQSTVSAQDFLVCGDYKVLVVDYKNSKDSIPTIKWEWDATKDTTLPEFYSKGKFRTMADCKLSPDGKQLIALSSSGGIALMTYPQKEIKFLAYMGNAHSIEFLPDGLIAIAGSIHAKGNKVAIYNPKVSDEPLVVDSLYSGHGLVWHKKKKLLYALGYDVLRAYEVNVSKDGGKIDLKKVNEWKIAGNNGHDLYLTPDGKKLFVTEHHNAWLFDIATEKFDLVPGFPQKDHVKSIGYNKKGQLIYTEPEESWWTYSVRFMNPERKFVFPGMHIYKARWAKF